MDKLRGELSSELAAAISRAEEAESSQSRAANSVAKAAKERSEMEEKFATEICQLKKALSDARANLHQQTGALEAKSIALQDEISNFQSDIAHKSEEIAVEKARNETLLERELAAQTACNEKEAELQRLRTTMQKLKEHLAESNGQVQNLDAAMVKANRAAAEKKSSLLTQRSCQQR